VKRLVKLSCRDTGFTALERKFPYAEDTDDQYVLEMRLKHMHYEVECGCCSRSCQVVDETCCARRGNNVINCVVELLNTVVG
jgi:hypothetical protein